MKTNFLKLDQVGTWLKLSAVAALLATSCTVDNESVELSGGSNSALSSKSLEIPVYGIVSDTEENKDSSVDFAIDDDADSKWLAYGDDVNIDLDLGNYQNVDYLKISFYEGDNKSFEFEVYSLVDGEYVKIGSKNSLGTNTELETFDVTNSETRYLRIKFEGNDVDLSNGVNDIEVWGTVLNEYPLPEEGTIPTHGFGPSSVEVGTITWKNWYLSIPIARTGDSDSGKAASIYYSDLESGNLGAEERKYFDYNDDGSYDMHTKFTGYTTSGYYEAFESKYCRTELREYWQGNQTTSDNWYMDDATHELETKLSVEKCEGEGKVYVAQIHGTKGTSLSGGTLTGGPATIKVQWYDNDIKLEYYTADGIVDGEWTSASGTVAKVTVGEVGNNEFIVRLKTEGGKFYMALYCEATGVDTGYVEYYDYLANGYEYQNYFKTGNYFRHDEDYTSVSEVTLYSAITNHTNAE